MRNIFSYILLIYALNYNAQPPNWTAIKDTTTPFIAIPTEFDTAYRLPHTVGGWEDSDFITRDGLTLYCLYAPIDAFSWLYGGGGQLPSQILLCFSRCVNEDHLVSFTAVLSLSSPRLYFAYFSRS